MRAAVTLDDLKQDGRRLVVSAEPAPYDVAPFDLWKWRAELPPSFDPLSPEPTVADLMGERRAVCVSTADTRVQTRGYVAGPLSAIPRFVTPISWANKPMIQRVATWAY